MDRDKSQDIAKKVGEQENLQQDHEFEEAHRKSGQKSGGNVKNDPTRPTEINRKGGKASHRQLFG